MRARCRCPSPVVPRVASFSVFCSSGRDACHAGTTPNSRPVTIESTTANVSAWPLTAIGATRGMSPGSSARMRSTPQNASSTPSPPPTTASSTLSVSSCRTSTPRPAPSAARIASSRARTVARAISRLATFATTISSTQSTAPSSTIKRRARGADQHVLQRPRQRREVRIGVGIGARQLLPDRVELGVGGGERHAGLQPRDAAQVVPSAVLPRIATAARRQVVDRGQPQFRPRRESSRSPASRRRSCRSRR